jgi:O-antigen ligase
LTIAVLTAAFYFIEHSNPPVANLEAYNVSGEEMVQRNSEGDLGRRVAIPAVALFGAIMLLRRDGLRVQMRSRLAWLLFCYFVWCGMSTLWSDDPQLTIRHFSVLFFCSVGIVGIARVLTQRELCVVALAGITILLLNAVYVEISLGAFHPLEPDYRFSGTLHPNAQAPNCALMVLAAGFLASRAKRGRIFLWALCFAGLALLVLTKSRTVCGALLISLAIYNSLAWSWRKRILVGVVALWIVSTVALAATLSGWNFEGQAANVALIGRQEEAETLTGRIPLWADLLPYVQESPVLGHGYMTFWTPERIGNFSHELQWTVPDGHCAYLDMLLELGIVGSVLCALTIYFGLGELRRRVFTSADLGCAFFFTLFICRSLNGVLESAFAVPTTFAAFIMASGLSHLVFGAAPGQLPAAEESPRAA